LYWDPVGKNNKEKGTYGLNRENPFVGAVSLPPSPPSPLSFNTVIYIN
jgi:hypothetical protein